MAAMQTQYSPPINYTPKNCNLGSKNIEIGDNYWSKILMYQNKREK